MTQLFLIIIILFLLFLLYKKEKDSKQREEDLKAEKVAKFDELEKNYRILKKSMDKSNEFANQNIGEVMASRDLNKIFEQFRNQGLIEVYRIIDNILFLEDDVRQIDHLVICDYGVFMIETKNWKGDVFYNVTKEALENTDGEIFNRHIFNDKLDYQYKTFVIKSDTLGNVEVLDYGNPYNQVNKTVRIVYKKILEKFNKKIFINGIVYFNYKDNQSDYLFFDGSSSNSAVDGINQKENLVRYFKEKFANNKKMLNINEVNSIADYIEQDIIL